MDFQFGSVATYLDLPRRESVYELLSDVSTADHDAFMNCLEIYQDRLHVLTAPADMLPLDIIEPDDMTRLLELASSSFDFIIIDMPTTVVGWTETVLNAADVYFALLELDMRSAQNTLRMLRTLRSSLRLRARFQGRPDQRRKMCARCGTTPQTPARDKATALGAPAG